MDWKDFFQLTVTRVDLDHHRPYFHSTLTVPDSFPMEELHVDNFKDWELREEEKRRLTLNHRKILHCHRYFNTPEFERISHNFTERLLAERARELHFSTQGGGIYLFLALMRSGAQELKGKEILCETAEFPIPVLKLPVENHPRIRLRYRPSSFSYFSGFPSLWAHPTVLRLFDPKAKLVA